MKECVEYNIFTRESVSEYGQQWKSLSLIASNITTLRSIFRVIGYDKVMNEKYAPNVST